MVRQNKSIDKLIDSMGHPPPLDRGAISCADVPDAIGADAFDRARLAGHSMTTPGGRPIRDAGLQVPAIGRVRA